MNTSHRPGSLMADGIAVSVVRARRGVAEGKYVAGAPLKKGLAVLPGSVRKREAQAARPVAAPCVLFFFPVTPGPRR